ncbi:MAG TPA: 2-phospho-L-lactate guanylyltransferase [Egibacteraceae bacterium]|nr:2-phospho-L-lactate guanylyltransferase [Egibacteraceae bacterium]
MSLTGEDAPIAIVPLKALDEAKSRLAGHLDQAQRRELTAWMLSRVLAACRAARSLGDVLVVAGDEAAALLARRLRADVILEPLPGLPAAMATADRATAGAPATLVVAADLPLAAPGDLDAVCRAGGNDACVVVSPTRDGGTAALLRRPGAVIATLYGAGSAAAHLRAGRQAGVQALRVRRAGLALDVDTAEDLRAAGRRDRRIARFVPGLSAG